MLPQIIVPPTRGATLAELTDSGGLGSRRVSHIGSKGDLRCELHYIGPTEHRFRKDRTAALYIYKVNAWKKGVFVPFGDMWRYAQADRMHQVVIPLAGRLYGEPATTAEQHRTLDCILDYLQDLKDHKPEPGLDATLDQFLEECEDEEVPFFVEVNGVRII